MKPSDCIHLNTHNRLPESSLLFFTLSPQIPCWSLLPDNVTSEYLLIHSLLISPCNISSKLSHDLCPPSSLTCSPANEFFVSPPYYWFSGTYTFHPDFLTACDLDLHHPLCLHSGYSCIQFLSRTTPHLSTPRTHFHRYSCVWRKQIHRGSSPSKIVREIKRVHCVFLYRSPLQYGASIQMSIAGVLRILKDAFIFSQNMQNNIGRYITRQINKQIVY